MRTPSLSCIIAYRLGAARWVYSHRSHKLRQHLLSSTGQSERPMTDCVIAANTRDYQNGGLCDCLHGIISLYYIAKAQHRQFKILFTHPFQLTDYLQPKDFDWRIEPTDIDYHTCLVRTVPMMLGRFHATWEEERAYHHKYLTQIVSQPGAQLIFTNAHLVGWQEYSHLFSELFQPTPQLQEQIDYHLAQIGRPYIGASFRFRNLLGDVSEPGSFPQSSQMQADLICRSIAQIEMLHAADPSKTIFVASDSAKFCASLQSLPYVYCIQGVRGHVAYQGTDTVMSTFLDLFLLSRSDGNTLFMTGQMYRSGFAMTASFIGNKSYHEQYF